eukprot:15361674-Ditylum_brightwellii.AAC.1
MAGGGYLQFTTKLWLPPLANTRHSPKQKDKREMGVTVIRDSAFPFLDMQMERDNESGEMRFSVFQKPNQALNYVDRNSTRQPTTFKSIANGVFTWLARLASKIAANGNAQIDNVYLDHAKALFVANLAPPTDFLTFDELWHDDEEQKRNQSNPSGVNRINVWFIL